MEEYRKHIEKDAALERRFQPVNVEEPSEAEAILDPEGCPRSRYEAHHQVKITRRVRWRRLCKACPGRYISDRFLPDKAIDLMDEAACQGVHCTGLPDRTALQEIEQQSKELPEKPRSRP